MLVTDHKDLMNLDEKTTLLPLATQEAFGEMVDEMGCRYTISPDIINKFVLSLKDIAVTPSNEEQARQARDLVHIVGRMIRNTNKRSGIGKSGYFGLLQDANKDLLVYHDGAYPRFKGQYDKKNVL